MAAMTEKEIIAAVASGKMKPEDAEKALQAARDNEPLKFKVGEKGGVSVYGLNARFPVTLYKGQWLRLANQLPALLKFIEENKGRLADKKAD